MSTGFSMKVTPKPKDEAGFKNFYSWTSSPQLEEFNNKVIYINAEHAGKHIYSPYFVEDGVACTMTMHKQGENSKIPIVTLQDLNLDDVIIHFSKEEYTKYMEDKKKKK